MAAATTDKKKVSTPSYIHNDIAFSILSKLPLKSLTRFTCAQKSWSLLFQNPIFMSMLHTNFFFKSKQYNDDDNTRLLLHQCNWMSFHNSLCILSGETFEDRVRLDWPPPFQNDDKYIDILGFTSVNGVLCICKGYYFKDAKTVLWNPATGEFKVIPPSHQPDECNYPPEGFGYDPVRDDYKVIRITQYPNMVFEGNWVWLPDKDTQFWVMDESWDEMLHDDDEFWEGGPITMYDPFWEIYSLKSNSWRILKCPSMPDPCDGGGGLRHVNLNEFCHWLMPQNYMLSFDFSNEIFFSTNLPSESDILPPRTLREKNLVVLNGSICLITNGFYGFFKAPFHIWILGELGVKESWTKFFVLGPLTFSVVRPIGGGKKSHIFIRKEDDELAWFDFSTQRIGEIGAKGDLVCMQIITYKESLLSFLE